MKKIRSYFKHIFSYKKNWFVLILSFVLVFISTITINTKYMDVKKYETASSYFPNNLVIKNQVSRYEINKYENSYLEGYKYFYIFECIESGLKTTNLDLKEDVDIAFYGIDNNFFSCPIILDDTDYGFNYFNFSSENSFSEEMFQHCGLFAFIPDNFIDSKSFSKFEIFGKTTEIIGTYRTLFESNKIFIFLPITTMVNMFSNSTRSFYSSIYFDIDSGGLPQYFSSNIFGKNNVNVVVNKYIEIANDSFSTFMSLILVANVAISILCIFTIKNRYNEIGIKLAIGATKLDIILEFLIENMSLLFISTIPSFALSTFITIIVESLQTLKYGISYFAINWSASILVVCIFILTSIFSALVPSIIGTNTNIETILKEER